MPIKQKIIIENYSINDISDKSWRNKPIIKLLCNRFGKIFQSICNKFPSSESYRRKPTQELSLLYSP